MDNRCIVHLFDRQAHQGFGFKVEKTKISGGRREGTIKEQSELFGKKYQYEFNFQKIRNDLEDAAKKHNYNFRYVLNQREVR